mgnify:CR=1 FL=1
MSNIVNIYEPTKESPPDILEVAIDLQKTIVNNGGSIRVRVLPESLALTLIEEFAKSGVTIKDTDVPYLEEFVDFLKTITVKDIEAFINIIKSQSKLGATYDISTQTGGGSFSLRTFLKFCIITFVMAMPSLAETKHQQEADALYLASEGIKVKRQEDSRQREKDVHASDQKERASKERRLNDLHKDEREKVRYDLARMNCDNAHLQEGIIGWLAQSTCKLQVATVSVGDLFQMMFYAIWEKGLKLAGLLMALSYIMPTIFKFIGATKGSVYSLTELASGVINLTAAKIIDPLNNRIGNEMLKANISNDYKAIILEMKRQSYQDLIGKKTSIYNNLAKYGHINQAQMAYIERVFHGLSNDIIKNIGSPGDNLLTSNDGITQKVIQMQLAAKNQPAATRYLEDMTARTIAEGVKVTSTELDIRLISDPQIGRFVNQQSQLQHESAFGTYKSESAIKPSTRPLHEAKLELGGGKANKTHGKGHMTRGKIIKRRGKGNKTRSKVNKTRGKVSKTRSKKRKVRKTRGKVKVSKTNSKVIKSRANSKY